jgi:cytochrome c553
MSPIAKALSEDDIADVTAYFAGVKAPFLPLATTTNATLLERGEQLAKIGSEAKGIPACISCHGADGAGQPPTIPYLGGQYGHYIAFELQMWQRGFRKTSPDAMALFAKKLNDQDIAALAAYLQSRPAPQDGESATKGQK